MGYNLTEDSYLETSTMRRPGLSWAAGPQKGKYWKGQYFILLCCSKLVHKHFNCKDRCGLSYEDMSVTSSSIGMMLRGVQQVERNS
jgi:hypothetical protein